jgi:hypothetical protein
MVGTGPPETTVGAPLYPFWSRGSAPAVGAAMIAAAHKPTNSDLRRCECSAMADLLSLALRPAYGPKVPLSWDLAIMVCTIIVSGQPDHRYRLTKRVHLLFTAVLV